MRKHVSGYRFAEIIKLCVNRNLILQLSLRQILCTETRRANILTGKSRDYSLKIEISRKRYLPSYSEQSSHLTDFLGGSRLIHFLQLRRFLRSLDGFTNTGGSPKCLTLPNGLWPCYMTKHQRMAQVGTWQQSRILGYCNGRRRYNIEMTWVFESEIDWCFEFVWTTSVR